MYVMVVVPAISALTTPDDEPMVAMAGLLLLQVPPGVASVSVVVKPMQPLVVPFMVPGSGFTVTAVIAVQPAESV